jgi:polyhydroxyalkanoate synthesis regulator phasin
MLDELRRVALFGSGVAELTKQRAERIVKELVGSGDVRGSQASAVVKDLMEASRQNRKELMRFVRSEVQSQMEGLGFATKRDFERLERRITRIEADLLTVTRRRKKTTQKTTRKKTTAKKTSAQRTAARRVGATKPPLAETPPTT